MFRHPRESLLIAVRFAAGRLPNELRAEALCLADQVPDEHLPDNHAEAAREIVEYVEGYGELPSWMDIPGSRASGRRSRHSVPDESGSATAA